MPPPSLPWSGKQLVRSMGTAGLLSMVPTCPAPARVAPPSSPGLPAPLRPPTLSSCGTQRPFVRPLQSWASAFSGQPPPSSSHCRLINSGCPPHLRVHGAPSETPRLPGLGRVGGRLAGREGRRPCTGLQQAPTPAAQRCSLPAACWGLGLGSLLLGTGVASLGGTAHPEPLCHGKGVKGWPRVPATSASLGPSPSLGRE